MANYPMSRLLLSIHTTPSSPTTITTTSVPEYSDVVIIFICLLCALICAVGVLGMIQWTCLRRSLPSTSATRTNDVEAPSECFKKKVVESLPTLVYKSSSTNEGKEECVICLSDFVDGEEIRVLPRCAHVFHVGCIDTWLIASNSLCCPSCRQVLVVSGCHKCEFDASARPPQIEVHYLP